MSGVTTAFLSQYKKDLFNGGAHILAAPVSPTGTPSNASKVITGMSSVAGIFRGMAISGTNIPAGAIVKSVDSTTQITISDAATGSPGSITLTITGDICKIALIKVGPAGTYDATSTKYGDITTNSDEVTGTGYTAGGQALTANRGGQLTSTTAYTQWTVDPSWTTATISTIGAMIYNTGVTGPIVNAGLGTFSFGGTQTVTAGTLTLVQPANDSTNALLRIA